jgi:hypothetical protein
MGRDELAEALVTLRSGLEEGEHRLDLDGSGLEEVFETHLGRRGR